MALAVKMRRLTHPVTCSVNKCSSRNTYMIHRGQDRSNPVHLCPNCMAEIVAEFIRLEGVERGREVFGGVMKVLVPPEEEPKAKPTAKSGVKSENPDGKKA